MRNGISVYAGLDCSMEENINLISNAAKVGLNRLFTSVQVPEANAEEFFEHFAAILGAALENDFEVILDVNSENITAFDFEQLTLRLDDGFSVGQVADLSQIHRIMLNASTINDEFLAALVDLNANFSNIAALHNFYPRPFTGLDLHYFKKQNQLIHDYGIEVGAFVASKDGRRRPPICEGLPTLEFTRDFSTDLAARTLAALGSDFIIISDSLPTFEECADVSNVIDNEVIFHANLSTSDPSIISLLNHSFKARAEISPNVIRAANSRSLFEFSGLTDEGVEIAPDMEPAQRFRGSVTVDNSDFGRYAGEVQIVKSTLPADSRVNVAAQIIDSDLHLIDFIDPNQSFSFKFI